MKRPHSQYTKNHACSLDNLSILLNPNQAAKLLGIKKETLAVWRATKKVQIPYVKIGGAVRYTRSALLDHISENTFQSAEKSKSEGGSK